MDTLKGVIKYSLMIMLILSSLELAWNPKVVLGTEQTQIVSQEQLKEYAQAFLSKYQNLIKGIPEENRSSFILSPYSKYQINAVISSANGVALEFQLSETESFKSEIVSQRVEDVIFYTTGDGNAAFHFEAVKWVLLIEVWVMNTTNPFDFGNDSSVLMNGTVVNGREYNYPILIKTNNEDANWTEEKAFEDAIGFFSTEMLNSVPEQFPRDYIEYALREDSSVITRGVIQKIAEKIVNKQVSGEYKNPDEFRNDWAELVETADNLGISEQLCNEYYEFYIEEWHIEVEKQVIETVNKPFYNKPEFWIPIFITFLLAVFGSIRWRRKHKKSGNQKVENRDDEKELSNWLTVREAAKYIRVSKSSIRNYIKMGELKAYRKGRIIRLKKRDLDNLLKNEQKIIQSQNESKDNNQQIEKES